MVGNTPNYNKYDILRCFLRLNKNIGRQELSKELGLGEGTVRTILEMLKSKKLLDSTKKGHFLSDKGIAELNKISRDITGPTIINAKAVYPEFRKAAILLRKFNQFKESYKLRDIAVKNDAEGALILKFENSLYAPESEYKGNFEEFEKYFDFENGNILIVAFANNAKDAETGAIAAAAELNDALKKFIENFE